MEKRLLGVISAEIFLDTILEQLVPQMSGRSF